ncbi:MAG: TasA family protein [Candidatus Woykebacteria bacterium]
MLERVDKKKIITSLITLVAAGALLVGATIAFFTDQETSQDNVFAAGSLDLKVDYDCYYNKIADDDPNCPWDDSSWEETDLGPQHKFFNFNDIKPGDFGEGTISLHVYNNDAWGRLVISDVQDLENTYLQAELDAGDAGVPDGELRENLGFRIWLDQGQTVGFQGTEDEGEGDNIWQQGDEPVLVTQGTVDLGGETHNIWQGLSAVYVAESCTTVDGNAGGDCPGIAQDGRLVGSVTYYFGIDWELPDTVGNEVQTDSLSADMTFEVVQHRNNPGKTGF